MRVEERAHVVELARLAPGERSEFEQPMLGPARKQAEDVAKIRPRLDAAEPRAREERGEDRVDLAAVVAPDEEPILPVMRSSA